MLSFYAPTDFEFPEDYKHKFQAFGMGPEKARDLARKLNLTKPRGWIVIAGCAGALKPGLKAGDNFVVNKVKSANREWVLNIPKELEVFSQATLTSVKMPVWQASEKADLHQKLGADIVDCEMEFILDALDESIHPQIIFLRTVIDESNHTVNFFDGYEMKPKKVLHPKEWFGFLRFVWSFFVFKRKHSQFFKRVDRVLFLDESTQALRENA